MNSFSSKLFSTRLDFTVNSHIRIQDKVTTFPSQKKVKKVTVRPPKAGLPAYLATKLDLKQPAGTKKTQKQ